MEYESTPVFRFNFAAASTAEAPQQNSYKNNHLSDNDAESDTLMRPSQEVFPAEVEAVKPVAMDPVVFKGGYTLLKGRVSTAEIIGAGKTDLLPGKYEGGLKLWECTIDLVNTMIQEIMDRQLSFEGKRVLELGCGHGLPGIFAILKGAPTVHFQDFNAEVLRSLTVKNVVANLEHERPGTKVDRVVISKPGQLIPDVHYYAGDWGSVYELLSVAESDCMIDKEDLSPTPFCYSGQDDGSIIQGEPPPLQSNQTSSSAAFKQAICDGLNGRYDIILMSETVYSLPSLPKLYNLIKKGRLSSHTCILFANLLILNSLCQCLRPPCGVLYVAAKKHYFGVGGGTRKFKALVEEDGVLKGHLVTDYADGSSNIREIWKFSFR